MMDQGPTTPPLDLTTPNQPVSVPTTKQSAGTVDLYGRTIEDTPAASISPEPLNTKFIPPLQSSPTAAMPHALTSGEKYKRIFTAAAAKQPSPLQLSLSAESSTSATRPVSPSEIGEINLPPGVTAPSAVVQVRTQLQEPSAPAEARIASVPEQHRQVSSSASTAGRRASAGRMAGLIIEGALRGSLSSNFNAHSRDTGRRTEPSLSTGVRVNRHSIGVRATLRF